jgi:CheY-like chemotaxis protein
MDRSSVSGVNRPVAFDELTMTEPKAKTVILVVDDEPLLRLDLEDSLYVTGYHVVAAADADEAIAVLMQRDDIGLVVTDIHMPGSMDGLELLRTIRNQWPDVRTMIASSQTRFEPGQIPQDVPVFGKPFPYAAINATAQQLLEMQLLEMDQAETPAPIAQRQDINPETFTGLCEPEQ